MRRRLLVLKMLTLALDELVARGVPLSPKQIVALTLHYGKGINIEEWEVEPFIEHRILHALVLSKCKACKPVV